MKVLKLESFIIKVPTNEGKKDMPVTYKDLIVGAVNNVGERGILIEEQRKRMRIIDALEKSTDELLLEDTDAENLKGLVQGMSYIFVDHGFIAFGDAVANMKAPVETSTQTEAPVVEPTVEPEVV